MLYAPTGPIQCLNMTVNGCDDVGNGSSVYFMWRQSLSGFHEKYDVIIEQMDDVRRLYSLCHGRHTWQFGESADEHSTPQSL